MVMGRPATCGCEVCPKCRHRIYMRAYYRRTHKSYVNPERRRVYERDRYHHNPDRRRKHNARQTAKQALRRGQLQPQPCALCGGPFSELHHNDYARPLDVVFLCAEDHRLIHGPLPSGDSP